jgi:beta-glucanase (GH16 family)
VIPAFLLLAASTFTVTNSTYRGPVRRPANARLVWSDEFSGDALDTRKWRYDTSRNKQGWYNGERQYYSAGENLRVANGVVTIEARHEKLAPRRFPDWGGQEYTSAKIFSTGAGWTYGFYEVRAKLPCARGTWPAIWMLPQAESRWPDGGEIDILEQVGSQPNVAHANLHTALFNHVKQTGRGAETPVPTACSAFHRYQLAWTPDAITAGVDGRAYMRVRNDQPGGRGAWPFDSPFYLILNLAMGGDWAGARGIDDAALPQRFDVDYVRVYDMPRARPAGRE